MVSMILFHVFLYKEFAYSLGNEYSIRDKFLFIFATRVEITVSVYRTFRSQQSGNIFTSLPGQNDSAFIDYPMERTASETADYTSYAGIFRCQVILDFDVAGIIQIQRINAFVVMWLQIAAYSSDFKCCGSILRIQPDISPIMEMFYVCFIGPELSENTTDAVVFRFGIGLPLHSQIAFILNANISLDKDLTIIGNHPDDSTYIGITTRIDSDIAFVNHLATQRHFHFGAVTIQMSDKST